MTYDPIKDQQSRLPPQAPGTTIITVERDSTRITERDTTSVVSKIRDRIELRIGLAALVLLVLATLVFGIVAFLLLALAASAAAFLFLQRDHPISRGIFGDAPKYVLVDTSRHTIKDNRKIQIEALIYADLTVAYDVRVKSPLLVYQEGVNDVRSFLSQKIFSRIVRLPSNVMEDNGYKYRQSLIEMTEKVMAETFDDVFQIENMTVDAEIVGSAGELISKINTSTIEEKADMLQADLDRKRRERIMELVDDPRKLEAAMMLPGSDKETIREALERVANRREVEHSRKMEMFRIAIEEGWIEGKDIEVSHPEIHEMIRNAVHSESNGIAKIDRRQVDNSNSLTSDSSEEENNG